MRDHPALAHKYLLPQFTRGTGIELGAGIDRGTTPLFPHFKKLSDVAPDWASGIGPDAPLDFVLLCEAPDQMTNATLLVREGGYICSVAGGELTVLRRTADFVEPVDLAIPGPSVCVVRYGGFGDMMQAASVFPALKREGFNVYVMTTPQGREVIEHDPHVDGFILQDTDQVPNDELTAFWDVQARRFDRFVNLSESVEGTLLAYPGRANHAWPDAVRRARMGRVNYLEFVAELAQTQFTAEGRFYPTQEEAAAVDRFLARIRARAAGVEGKTGPVHAPATFNVLWTLAGSSVHKMYPHQDTVIANLLRAIPELTVTLVGDQLCQILESGWEDNPRVNCLSGKIGIRETLTLAQRVDVVVGPETGVLNAVGFEPNAKVCILSHSSAENLTKHWVNVEAIEPPTACFPCHRLHHDRRYCPEHEPTGASLCAWEVDPYRVFAAVARAYGDWKRLRELRAAA